MTQWLKTRFAMLGTWVQGSKLSQATENGAQALQPPGLHCAAGASTRRKKTPRAAADAQRGQVDAARCSLSFTN